MSTYLCDIKKSNISMLLAQWKMFNIVNFVLLKTSIMSVYDNNKPILDKLLSLLSSLIK